MPRSRPRLGRVPGSSGADRRPGRRAASDPPRRRRSRASPSRSCPSRRRPPAAEGRPTRPAPPTRPRPPTRPTRPTRPPRARRARAARPRPSRPATRQSSTTAPASTSGDRVEQLDVLHDLATGCSGTGTGRGRSAGRPGSVRDAVGSGSAAEVRVDDEEPADRSPTRPRRRTAGRRAPSRRRPRRNASATATIKASGSTGNGAVVDDRHRRHDDDRDEDPEDRPAGDRGQPRAAPCRRRSPDQVRRHDPVDERDDRDEHRRRAIAARLGGEDEFGMIGGQACESGTARSTPTKPHSGRSSSQRIAGPRIATRRRDLREEPRPARRAVPQLGEEVGEGEDQERQARVVVVLERRPVDPGPGDPLAGERRS